jgi:hypothetical protein
MPSTAASFFFLDAIAEGRNWAGGYYFWYWRQNCGLGTRGRVAE